MSRYKVGEPEDKREGDSLKHITIQRAPEPGASDSAGLQSSFGNAAVAQSLTQGKGTTPAHGLVVDDAAETLQPGQMKKSDFLAQLRGSVSRVTEETAGSLGGVGASIYINQQFSYYAGQSAQQIEQAIRRQVPEAAGSTSAGGYIAAVTARVRQTLSTSGAAGGTAGTPEGTQGGGVIGTAMSVIGSIFFKEREGGAREGSDPSEVQSRLGSGQLLDGDVKARMESAFGESFSGIEVHSDANAAGLSSNLNARAFTVGSHIAFGTGEYQPGTLIGDALIAHELAHVVQQRSGQTAIDSKGGGATAYSALEEDADQAAVGAIISTWGSAKGKLASIGRNVMPSLKSGLRLQRCPSSTPSTATLTDRQIQEAITYNNGLGHDADTIRSLQTLVGASATGTWDSAGVLKVAVWQGANGITASGKIDAATLKAMVLALVAGSKHDEAIHIIVDAYNFNTTNLARIYYDSTYTDADALTSGTIATGEPQTVKVGPSTFAGSYEHSVRIIGHELQHVQQRSGASPILNQDVREFLAYAWEALDTTTPALTPAERVAHANLAIRRYNRFSPAEKTTHDAMYQRLNRLIADGGVGNP